MRPRVASTMCFVNATYSDFVISTFLLRGVVVAQDRPPPAD
jgi:hypothetical protein